MTWSLLAHNVWIMLVSCTGTAIIGLFLYACAVLYNRAYMRLVKHYQRKESKQ